MIFVTIGGQLPFDRLITGVDTWAASRRREDVVAQIGRTDKPPSHMEWCDFMSQSQYGEMMSVASVVVGHAGIGTILTALQAEVPLIVMPRLARFSEHRNDHQSATCAQLDGRAGLTVVNDIDELHRALDDPPKAHLEHRSADAPRLVNHIRSVILRRSGLRSTAESSR